MSFKATVCLSCQRDIQIPSDVPNPACPYCGAAVSPKSATPTTTISNLMGMAKTAELAGNNVEAMTYFNRVLEADPTCSDAWIGKGKAAGWQTTLANIRVPEMLVAFEHAIATAIPDTKEATVKLVTHEANHLIVTIYTMARNHMLEYVSLQNSWTDYLGQMSQMVDALEEVNLWNPTDRTTLENIVHLCKDNIEGVSYHDQFNNNAPNVWSLSYEYESLLKSKLDNAVYRIKVLYPDYSAPDITKKTAENCFVITATMGDSSHPDVRFLQNFRDEWLRQYSWGAKFIAWYYQNGPAAAAFIAKSSVRRRLSYHIVVKPAVWVAERFIQREL